MPIDKALLEIIVCPNCKGELIYEEERDRLLCKNCLLAYPIREDIPILLIDEAERIPADMQNSDS